MKIAISLRKDNQELAREVADIIAPGDLKDAVGRVFDKARTVYPDPLWDCDLEIRSAEESS